MSVTNGQIRNIRKAFKENILDRLRKPCDPIFKTLFPKGFWKNKNNLHDIHDFMEGVGIAIASLKFDSDMAHKDLRIEKRKHEKEIEKWKKRYEEMKAERDFANEIWNQEDDDEDDTVDPFED